MLTLQDASTQDEPGSGTTRSGRMTLLPAGVRTGWGGRINRSPPAPRGPGALLLLLRCAQLSGRGRRWQRRAMYAPPPAQRTQAGERSPRVAGSSSWIAAQHPVGRTALALGRRRAWWWAPGALAALVVVSQELDSSPGREDVPTNPPKRRRAQRAPRGKLNRPKEERQQEEPASVEAAAACGICATRKRHPRSCVLALVIPVRAC